LNKAKVRPPLLGPEDWAPLLGTTARSGWP